MPDNKVVLPEPQVSRVHCQVVKAEQGWQVRDLGGVNGTVLNGKRVKEHMLSPGDVIQVGKSVLRFGMGPVSEEAKQAAMELPVAAEQQAETMEDAKGAPADPYDHKVSDAVGQGGADLAATVKMELEGLQKQTAKPPAEEPPEEPAAPQADTEKPAELGALMDALDQMEGETEDPAPAAPAITPPQPGAATVRMEALNDDAAPPKQDDEETDDDVPLPSPDADPIEETDPDDMEPWQLADQQIQETRKPFPVIKVVLSVAVGAALAAGVFAYVKGTLPWQKKAGKGSAVESAESKSTSDEEATSPDAAGDPPQTP